MKQKLTLFIIATCTLPALLSFSGRRPKKSLFNAAWQQFIDFNLNGGQSTQYKLILMKVFSNGKFDGYLMRPEGSVKTMGGTYKILNDSVYTETLITARNGSTAGRTYVIKYQLKGNVMIAAGSYDVSNSGETYKLATTKPGKGLNTG